MNSVDAIAKVESLFIVHDEMGMPVAHTSDDGTVTHTGARDMSKAPSGEPYVSLVSAGVQEPGDDAPVWFTSREFAWRWWIYAIEDYAEGIAPREEWGTLHLYWRDRPTFTATEFIAMNQPDLVRTQSPLAAHMQVTLGFVHSRLLISRRGPDDEETSNA